MLRGVGGFTAIHPPRAGPDTPTIYAIFLIFNAYFA